MEAWVFPSQNCRARALCRSPWVIAGDVITWCALRRWVWRFLAHFAHGTGVAEGQGPWDPRQT
eukprot:4252424-Alexandrium_andersonii.AAC.1